MEGYVLLRKGIESESILANPLLDLSCFLSFICFCAYPYGNEIVEIRV